jgi:NAD(P)-dependent dehydrogenase (short-subunit alcohol dehydrogenase family)
MEIAGKVFLVTGASSGIGRELAAQLARAGAKLAVAARNAARLDELAREIAAAGGEALAIPTDVTERASVRAAVQRTLERYGRLDALVNAAGLGYFGPAATMTIADFDRVLQTNVHGILHAVQEALPALERSRGLVVNVSSGLAMRALPFLSAYAGTKSMVNALSDGLRLELAPRGVRVLAYCPPQTDSGFDRNSLKGPGMEAVSFSGMKTAKVPRVAADMLRAIRRDRRRSGGRFFLVMNALAPGLLDRMFAGMVRRLSRTAP